MNSNTVIKKACDQYSLCKSSALCFHLSTDEKRTGSWVAGSKDLHLVPLVMNQVPRMPNSLT